jgi:8-oxo-dGTP pyrophosphatase MutT (NUDIX family)
MKDLKYFLEKELGQPLPGSEAQLRMATEVHRPVPADLPLRNGGVLILLYPHEGKWHIVFIKRTEYNSVHSGQVSFPGGMYEEKDGTLMNTALREAMEETGLDIQEVKIVGMLSPLHISVSNVHVQPFVGFADERPRFNHDPVEVQYLIEESLDELMNETNHKIKNMSIFGREVAVPYFDVKGEHVWGATAMILSEFAEILKKVKSGDE